MIGQRFLLLVFLAAASSQLLTVKDRLKRTVAIWGTTMAHCSEAAAKDLGAVDEKKFKACKKCHSGVGNWLTKEGLERGKACLQEFEPGTIAACGELMDKMVEQEFDFGEVDKALGCWEQIHRKSIGEKCLKSTGGEDMVTAGLCVMEHLRRDHLYAEKVILGEDPHEKADPTNMSRLQRVVESILVEGRCIHANEGNEDRIAECVTCFNKANPMLMGSDDKMEEHHHGHHGREDTACANVYL